jgi:polyisoprenoid-binding protein YceI
MAQTTWVSDSMHSEIGFKVKHLMIASVKGRFESFEASATTEGDDFSNAQVSFSADVSSIKTGVADRDGHLTAPDFFDAATFPKISFKSTSMTSKGDDEYELQGDLTIRDVTKPVKLDVEFGGIMKDAYGQTKAGFTLEGKVNRKEFGLTWNALTETGGVMLGEDVKLQIDVQFVKQA